MQVFEPSRCSFSDFHPGLPVQRLLVWSQICGVELWVSNVIKKTMNNWKYEKYCFKNIYILDWWVQWNKVKRIVFCIEAVKQNFIFKNSLRSVFVRIIFKNIVKHMYRVFSGLPRRWSSKEPLAMYSYTKILWSPSQQYPTMFTRLVWWRRLNMKTSTRNSLLPWNPFLSSLLTATLWGLKKTILKH